jgi:toxin ParE1/3/4
VPRRVVIEPGARDDLANTFRWYEARRRGLGRQFLAAAGNTFRFIALFPLSRPLVIDALRRADFLRFPYAAFYIDNASRDVLHVLAVLHHHSVTDDRLQKLQDAL